MHTNSHTCTQHTHTHSHHMLEHTCSIKCIQQPKHSHTLTLVNTNALTRTQRNMHTRTHMDTFTHMDTHPQGPISYLSISLSYSCSFKHPKWFSSKAKWRSLRATYHLIITIIGFWVSVLFFEKKVSEFLKIISERLVTCWKIQWYQKASFHVEKLFQSWSTHGKG